MKKPLIFCSAFLSIVFAQNVAINNTGAIGNSNAILDVDVSINDKGVIIPRLTTAQRTGIAGLGPADEGLTVYDEVLNSFWFWDGTQWVQMQNSSAGWQVTGNTGTNPATNFVGTIDNQSLVIRTNNTERVRVLTNGNVGIGTSTPTQRLDVVGNIIANTGIVYANNTNNTFHGGTVGLFGAAAGWNPSTAGGNGTFVESNEGGESGGFFANGDQITMWTPGDGGYLFRLFDEDVLPGGTPALDLDGAGNVGIAVATPLARLHVVGGSIRPQSGNDALSGIYFTPNVGGGGGDEAFIRHYAEAGENTKLVIGNLNDFDDDISFRTGGNLERIQINGNGTVYLNRGVFFDCNDCGATNAYDLGDGGGANWGDLSIQGRVLSTNSNLHLSPPGGSKVIINSTYRAAGGATGTTGLDIEDGGIRMRKNYMYFQRYRYCNCYGAGASTYGLGNWDFCAVAQVGFKNNQSNADEDDDVQCAVYPNGAGAGEQTNYDYYYTEQFNTKRAWTMYLEAYEDTNGVTCAATCMNFE